MRAPNPVLAPSHNRVDGHGRVLVLFREPLPRFDLVQGDGLAHAHELDHARRQAQVNVGGPVPEQTRVLDPVFEHALGHVWVHVSILIQSMVKALYTSMGVNLFEDKVLAKSATVYEFDSEGLILTQYQPRAMSSVSSMIMSSRL